MATAVPTPAETRARARAWRDAQHAAVCDVITPWTHGTVVRATRYPSFYDLNVVRVEREVALRADALAALADGALAGLRHRRLDFDEIDSAQRLRASFQAKGWKAMRLLWLRHDDPLAAARDHPLAGARPARVELVPYELVHPLRVAWHREDWPEQSSQEELAGFFQQAAEVARRRGSRVLAVLEAGAPVAFAAYERHGQAAEITQLFVLAGHRGCGYGTELLRAALGALGDVRDLWICADDDDWPKELYRRVGFRAAWTTMEFLRVP